ncbi:MAG: tetratricopeptide repeat protein [Methylobacter sp.]
MKRRHPTISQSKRPAAIKSKQPDTAAKLNTAFAMHQQGQLHQAEALYKDILQTQPQHFDALQLLAMIAAQRNNFNVAADLFDQALNINPNSLSVLINRGNVLYDLQRYGEALKSYECALNVDPNNADVLINRGNILNDLNLHEEALKSYDQALKIKPDYAEAFNNRGNALRGLNRNEEALESYGLALKINPDYADALNNLGNALYDLERYEEALKSYDHALKIKPEYAETLYNRGNALYDLKHYKEALESYNRALRINPNHLRSLNNRGTALRDLKRYEEAIESYDRALKIKPDYIEALNNRGTALCDLMRHEEALESYDSVLKLRPDYAQALYNSGAVLCDLMRHEEALENYAQALKIKPDYEFLYGIWLHTKMMICDWNDIDCQFIHAVEKIKSNEKVSPPFSIFAISNSLAVQRKAAEIYVQTNHPKSHELSKIAKLPRHHKIRIGYFSADFHNHATAYLIAELFERHDKSKFELTAFSFGPDTQDEMRKRLVPAFDHFINARDQSDKDVAQLARNLELDIAVDLGGLTNHSRTGIFAMQAAPLQVSYLGYPGTMGASYINYLIADSTLIPESYQHGYTEKIVYLPNSYQINDSKRSISNKEFTRTEMGLPATGFVFCCFNNNYKITPSTFDSWMRILKQVDASVLWLFESTVEAVNNLKKEAELRGVNAERLIFAKRIPLHEHLARHRLADLFLDTLPYNAHTTASDALWAGLPVLTCIGETFASRVAASLLNAIHLPELITSTPEIYEAVAIEIANSPNKLMEIKKRLADNRVTTPLFNTQLLAKHLEAAYMEMYRRYQADLVPEHIYVQN